MALQRKLHYTFRQWFLMGVDSKEDRTACWNWMRACSKGRDGQNNRYGCFKFEGVQRYSHRVAYELEHGPIEGKLQVCHTCDNTQCCNPFHMFLGSARDNMQDSQQKGRRRFKPGKLNADQVKELRKLRSEGVPYDDLEKRFSLNRASLHDAATGKTYKYIT